MRLPSQQVCNSRGNDCTRYRHIRAFALCCGGLQLSASEARAGMSRGGPPRTQLCQVLLMVNVYLEDSGEGAGGSAAEVSPDVRGAHRRFHVIDQVAVRQNSSSLVT